MFSMRHSHRVVIRSGRLKKWGDFANICENPSNWSIFWATIGFNFIFKLGHVFVTAFPVAEQIQTFALGLQETPLASCEVLTRAAFCRMACAFEGFRSQGRPWLNRSVSWKFLEVVWLVRQFFGAQKGSSWFD